MSKRAITVFTNLVCLEKNLQNTAPNNAHTKEPEAPIRDSMTVTQLMLFLNNKLAGYKETLL